MKKAGIKLQSCHDLWLQQTARRRNKQRRVRSLQKRRVRDGRTRSGVGQGGQVSE